MNEVIAWVEFAGDIDREGIEGVKASAIRAVRPPSAWWWWLLPPVTYVLRRRWNTAFRQATLAQLTESQREEFTSFRNKATGWFTVAAGGTLLAVGETWQIIERHSWPVWLFWLLIVVMLTASMLNTAARMISEQHTRHRAGAEPAPAAEQR